MTSVSGDADASQEWSSANEGEWRRGGPNFTKQKRCGEDGVPPEKILEESGRVQENGPEGRARMKSVR